MFAADAAYGAVAQPVEGTMLTVAREAATAALAAADQGNSLAEVCLAAVGSRPGRAWTNHRATRAAAAGRGGRRRWGRAGGDPRRDGVGAVREGPVGYFRSAPRLAIPAELEAGTDLGPDGPAYEVMYLLDAPDEAVGEFRQRLDRPR